MMKNNLNQNYQTALPQLKVVEINSNNEVVCRFCESKDYTTAGKRYYKKDGISKTQQRYQCKSCGRKFILGSQRTDVHTLEMPDSFAFDSDIWLASHLGLRVSLHLDPH